jgi:Tfp pilus assembly protein PilF
MRPDVSEVVEDMVSHALARDPQMRFQSMWELSAALKFASGTSAGSSPSAAGAAPASTASARPAPPSAPPVESDVARVSSSASVAASSAFRGTRRRAVATVLLLAVAIGAVLAVRAWRANRVMTAPPASTSAPTSPPPLTGTPVELTQQGLALIRRFDLAGNVDKAIASFESAIAQNGGYAPAWAGLARAYWRKQAELRDASWGARALDAATQAISLDQYLADAHVSLGLVKLTSGDRDAARQSFDHALVLDPTNAGAHRGFGAIEKAADRFDEARAHFDQALTTDPRTGS